MDEETRRKEILMAEESINRLYKEMARASGMADEAEAAREELEQANRAIGKAIEDLKSLINTQRIYANETDKTLDQSKKSLENAIITLLDASSKMDSTQIHIVKTLEEVKAVSNTIETRISKILLAFSNELNQEDKLIKEQHNELKWILESQSEKLQKADQLIIAGNNKLSESLANEFLKTETQAGIRYNESLKIIKDKSDKLYSEIESIKDNSNKLSESFDKDFSMAENQASNRHNDIMQIQSKSLNELKEIREGKLPGILSLLRFAMIAAIISAVASIITLLKGFI